MSISPVVIKLGGSLAVPPRMRPGESAAAPVATGLSPDRSSAALTPDETAPSGPQSAAKAIGAPAADATEAEQGGLARWLAVVASARRPVVVVPGGGAFADTVRAEQQRLGFSDEAAHYMAILAMHQTGTLLVDMQPERLTAAATEAELRGALGRGDIPVWMALSMAIGAPDLPRDWSVTSDGLAAWLARELRIAEVWLVKSRAAPEGAALGGLVDEGLVDPVFARIAGATGLCWRLFGPGDEAAMSAALSPDMEAAPDG
jgi:aspartokinase-like uncharacterized kinase